MSTATGLVTASYFSTLTSPGTSSSGTVSAWGWGLEWGVVRGRGWGMGGEGWEMGGGGLGEGLGDGRGSGEED